MFCWPCIWIYLCKEYIKLVFLNTNVWSRFLLEKLIVCLLVDKLCTFYQTQSLTLLLPATCLWPQADQCNPCPPSCFLNICFNVTHPSMRGSSKSCVSVRVSRSNTMYKPFHRACYIPHISHRLFDLSNNILWRLEIYKSPHNIIFFIPLLPSPI